MGGVSFSTGLFVGLSKPGANSVSRDVVPGVRPEAQPARSPIAPQNTRTGISRFITSTEIERDGKGASSVFITQVTPQATAIL